mmetsp:Transcript_92093/g.260189  ORF Transcript_92093/g.260189 Transcript_92093/m.260189 type:complete len:212 (-) Transcript_92093:98-733(-)
MQRLQGREFTERGGNVHLGIHVLVLVEHLKHVEVGSAQSISEAEWAHNHGIELAIVCLHPFFQVLLELRVVLTLVAADILERIDEIDHHVAQVIDLLNELHRAQAIGGSLAVEPEAVSEVEEAGVRLAYAHVAVQNVRQVRKRVLRLHRFLLAAEPLAGLSHLEVSVVGSGVLEHHAQRGAQPTDGPISHLDLPSLPLLCQEASEACVPHL